MDSRLLDRRDFLKAILRAGVLAGLAAVTFRAMAGRGGPCSRPAGACARCARAARCDQPQAAAGRGRGGTP